MSEEDAGTRLCGSCMKVLPLEAFYKDGKDNNGNVRYRRDCKDCYKKMRIIEKGRIKR